MTNSDTDQARIEAELARAEAERAQLAPSSEGSVMIDLGGDIGALVLLTGPELALAEIEVSRVDCAYPLAEGYQLPHQHHLGEDHSHDESHSHSHDGQHSHDHAATHGHVHPRAAAQAGDGEHAALRTHVAVRERHVGEGVRHAAIYGGLLSGDYRLWNIDGTPGDVVTIVGGQVTEHDWR